MTKKVQDFLRESNAIEDVYDQQSLWQAEAAWEYLVAQKIITPTVVLQTHKILMAFQPLAADEKGQFRKIPVWVGGREGIPWQDIPIQINLWCNQTNKSPLTPKTLHVEYEKIHPFVDGNGRTGRMFLNWTRLQRKLPILVIKASERWKYYDWFRV